MTRKKLQEASIEELVERFVANAVEQDKAMLWADNAKFRRLYWQLESIEAELKTRQGDQRRVLLVLYRHPHMQVRLRAALATLAIAPGDARKMLQEIADTGWLPQAGDAGMTLFELDRGNFVPK